ncbi:MAG TPA: VTT domain-containing protein [Candidatus Paceibacterota bacterium]
MPELTRGRDIWKSLLGLAVAIGILIAIFRYFDIETVRAYIEGAGIYAPLALVAAKASTLIIAPLGGAPLYPLGGALFGFWKAVALLMLGNALGATVCFYLSRFFGRSMVERMLGKQGGMLGTALAMMSTVRGFFVARLCFATFPELAAYAAGLTRLPFVAFILIHLVIDIIPTLIWVSLGVFIAQGQSSLAFLSVFAVAGTSTLIGLLLFNRMVATEEGTRLREQQEANT